VGLLIAETLQYWAEVSSPDRLVLRFGWHAEQAICRILRLPSRPLNNHRMLDGFGHDGQGVDGAFAGGDGVGQESQDPGALGDFLGVPALFGVVAERGNDADRDVGGADLPALLLRIDAALWDGSLIAQAEVAGEGEPLPSIW